MVEFLFILLSATISVQTNTIDHYPKTEETSKTDTKNRLDKITLNGDKDNKYYKVPQNISTIIIQLQKGLGEKFQYQYDPKSKDLFLIQNE